MDHSEDNDGPSGSAAPVPLSPSEEPEAAPEPEPREGVEETSLIGLPEKAQSRLSLLEKPPKPARTRPRPLRALVHHHSSSHERPSILTPQSPMTPSSMFSFDFTDSPGFVTPTAMLPAKKDGRHVSMFPFESSLVSLEEVSVESDDGREGKKPRRKSLPDGSRRASRVSRISQLTATDWRGVKIASTVVFLMRIQFTIFFASIWPMMKQLDPESDNSFYSLMCSMYSLGVALAAPAFGYLAQKFGFRKPTLLTLVLMLATDVMFIFLDHIPANRRFYLLGIRILVGIAAGGSSIMNTYWCNVTAEKDRATAASHTDAALSLGLAFGPLFQVLFSPDVVASFKFPGVKLYGVSINLYTMPAISAILVVFLLFGMMLCCFEEPQRKCCSERSLDRVPDSSSTSSESYDTDSLSDVKIDKVAIFVCMTIKTVQMLFYASIETTTSIFINLMFASGMEKTATLGSTLTAGSGLLGFAFLLVYVWTGLAKRFENRAAVITGISICILYLLATYPYPHYGEFIAASPSCTADWCATTTKVPFYTFATFYLLLFGVGFPLLNVHLTALLANIIGDGKQQVWHSISIFVSTLPRIVGPRMATTLLDHRGLSSLYWVQAAVNFLLLGLVIVSYNRLGEKVSPLKALARLGHKLLCFKT